MTQTSDAEQLFARMATRFLADPSVGQGTGFGPSPGLRVGGRIFAMLAHGDLVVKLPKDRVDQLVASGTGDRFEPRHDGRLMKEWLAVSAGHLAEWEGLADEALRFVGSVTKKGRR
jgi:hypothetical protein